MYRISVIVPVYNVEKYILRCIESIQKQTIKQIQIILIDDGSRDQSGVLCDESAKTDNRIIVIHQENSGVSAARNAGIKLASGEYISFIDADDFIDPNMLEKLYLLAIENDADIVACAAHYCSENGKVQYDSLTAKGTYNKEELLASLFALPNPLGGCIWNKLYKKETMGNVLFPLGIAMAEDRIFLYDFYLNCGKGYKTEEALYYVVDRSDSATHTRKLADTCTMLNSSKFMMDKSRKYSRELGAAATIKYLDDCTKYIPEIKSFDSSEKNRIILKYKISMLKELISGRIIYKIRRSKFNAYLNWLLKDK